MRASCALLETSLRHRAVGCPAPFFKGGWRGPGCLPGRGEVALAPERLTDRLSAPSQNLSKSLKSLSTLYELHGVCPRTADRHTEVEMRFELALDIGGIADLPDYLAHGDFLSRFDTDTLVKTAVVTDNTVAVIYDNTAVRFIPAVLRFRSGTSSRSH